LETLLDRSQDSGDVARGVLPDGSHYCVVRSAEDVPLTRESDDASSCSCVIAFASGAICPGKISFAREVYVRGDFTGGAHNQYRALLGVGNVSVGKYSTILRWAHSGGEFSADEGCALYGRISAERRVELNRGSRFLRINAPRIDVGRSDKRRTDIEDVKAGTLASTTQRTLYDGDLVISEGEVHYGNIVTRGQLHIRAGARVVGSIKSNKELVIENEVIVEGSVICAERIIVGSRCYLYGPIIAERSMVLYSDSVCGSVHRPTTVSSPDIQVQEGLVVFGTLWARESGSVWGRA